MEILNYANITVDYLNEVNNKYKTEYDSLLSYLSNIQDSKLSWNTFIQPLLDFENTNLEISKLNMKDFHPDEEIRDTCVVLDTELSQFMIEQNMRKDYFNKFSYYYQNVKDTENLNQEQLKYLENVHLNYKMMGMYLDNESYEKVKELEKKLSELCDEYNSNVNSENTEFILTKDDLTGLPEKYLNERLNQDGTYKITLKYPDYIPLMEYCQNRNTRKNISLAYNSRCKIENSQIASQVFKLRNDLASVFGFSKYSDYILQDKMAKTTDTVMNFLNDVYTKIQDKRDYDLKELLELAKLDNVNQLELYDIAYYSRIYKEKLLGISKEDLNKHFKLDKVLTGMFTIYSKLLGFKFYELQTYNHTLWHDTVKLYSVNDLSDNVIGYFYLDLYPREGKYSHAACFDIIKKSTNIKPVAFMACNFTKNGDIEFDEVETLFHEFGHVMHHMSAKCTISDLSSFSCENDFVETPSQLFEEWCYHPNSLKLMAEETITDEIIEKIILSRKVLQGYHYARQLLFAIFDMRIHGIEFNKNYLELYNEVFEKVVTLPFLKDTDPVTAFGHLFGGYASGYYGYLWSLVYAKDLFTKFIGQEHNQSLGLLLKNTVLSQGSMRSSLDSMREFLGREPNSDYFIQSL